MAPLQKNYGYSGGVELTEELIQSLAQEAEKGYRLSELEEIIYTSFPEPEVDITPRFPKELTKRMVKCLRCGHLSYLDLQSNMVTCSFCNKGGVKWRMR